MKLFHRWMALGACAILTCSAIGCGSEPASYQPLPQDGGEMYHISLCQDADSAYYNTITRGFTDALNDLFGENHVQLNTNVVSEYLTAEEICQNAVERRSELIFANGSVSLSAATTATTETPIVGGGVMNFQSALNIITKPGEPWDLLTNTNVTGVSATPDIAQQLSLLIEATPQLNGVGILYSPEDSDAIYQNQILEGYLDEAGIPWKEYQLTSTVPHSASAEIITEDLPLTSSYKIVAPSAREGADTDVEILESDLSAGGINAPSSARPSQTSKFWTGSAETPSADMSTEEIVAYASAECNALYIPAESNLQDQMDVITATATRAGVSTVAGDANLGGQALVTLHSDPYAMGYAAGKLAYRILINGDDPGSIKINTRATSQTSKLYNAQIAQALGIEFPKSFTEYEAFQLTYEPGSTTERIGSDDTDDP